MLTLIAKVVFDRHVYFKVPQGFVSLRFVHILHALSNQLDVLLLITVLEKVILRLLNLHFQRLCLERDCIEFAITAVLGSLILRIVGGGREAEVIRVRTR